MLSADEFLASELLTSATTPTPLNFGAIQAELTSKKDYLSAYIYVNITSFSQRNDLLHRCQRKYAISKFPRNLTVSNNMPDIDIPNIHFAYGHSVGAGIQTYLATRNREQSLFAAFLAWNVDLDFSSPKHHKSQIEAHLAVEKFCILWEQSYAEDWEIAIFNGRPATELTFFLDTENGFYHVGHVDAILRHRKTGKYMVLELKTTSFKSIDEAQFGNSDQGLGYSIMLDKIVSSEGDGAGGISSFDVLYLAYSTGIRDFMPLLFSKSKTNRAEWLQDLILDHASIRTYVELNFFPKRGSACWSFKGRCPHYGVCDMPPSALGAGANSAGKRLSEIFLWFDRKTMELPEKVDFEFKISDLVSSMSEGRI